ncbi:hypothetical protein [Yersinia enterocolitica]|nr:hypothetical protein [Yersinia enterocolitica]
MGTGSRATMRAAPDEPKKPSASMSHFYGQVNHQAIEPFMSQ